MHEGSHSRMRRPRSIHSSTAHNEAGTDNKDGRRGPQKEKGRASAAFVRQDTTGSNHSAAAFKKQGIDMGNEDVVKESVQTLRARYCMRRRRFLEKEIEKKRGVIEWKKEKLERLQRERDEIPEFQETFTEIIAPAVGIAADQPLPTKSS